MPQPTHIPLRGGPVVRWGVLAPGGIARDWVNTLHANTDQRVVAVASRSAERAAQFAHAHGIPRSFGGYEALVADPEVDVVYIASPHTEHRALALLAISAGNFFTSLVYWFIGNPDGTAKITGVQFNLFFAGLCLATMVVFALFARGYREKTILQDEAPATV